MRRLTVLLASTAMVLGLGVYALAQTGPTPDPNKGERSRASLLQRLDADKDGKVTKSEFAAAQETQFKAADKNGDGFIDKAEFTAFGHERRAAFVDRLFARLDKNGDGKLTADELAARGDREGRRGHRAERALNFERADTERKGFLTLDDYVKARGARIEAATKRRFERLDVNRDGKLTADELPAERKDIVMRADANKDGAVSFEEFAARGSQFLKQRSEAQFRALDANGDGKLTKGEADAARGKPMLLLLADADKDGVVTKEELAKSFARNREVTGERIFAALDADKDGKISAAEWKASGERRFARLDRDGNGVIEAAELTRSRGNKRTR